MFSWRIRPPKTQRSIRAHLAPDRLRSLTSVPLTVCTHLAEFLMVDVEGGELRRTEWYLTHLPCISRRSSSAGP